MKSRSRATLFLIEQLIVVAIFAICAAGCVGTLVSAYISARDSRDITNALLVAENGAESFKATGGEAGVVADILGGVLVNESGSLTAVVYYNDQWRRCTENDAFYSMRIAAESPASRAANDDNVYSTLTVEKLTGEVIVTFPVIAGAGR